MLLQQFGENGEKVGFSERGGIVCCKATKP